MGSVCGYIILIFIKFGFPKSACFRLMKEIRKNPQSGKNPDWKFFSRFLEMNSCCSDIFKNSAILVLFEWSIQLQAQIQCRDF